jgi:hypothetical protein
MERKGPFPCSLEPVTGPYPEPDEPSSRSHILIIFRYVLMLSFSLRIGRQRGLEC